MEKRNTTLWVEGNKWVADRIREKRKKAGMRQIDLAQKIGVTQQFISDLEKRRNRIPAGMLWPVARALGIHASELLDKPKRENASTTQG